jgi:hypothetical protein
MSRLVFGAEDKSWLLPVKCLSKPLLSKEVIALDQKTFFKQYRWDNSCGLCIEQKLVAHANTPIRHMYWNSGTTKEGAYIVGNTSVITSIVLGEGFEQMIDSNN